MTSAAAQHLTAPAEAKLEQIENQIAISVVHSHAVADGGEEDKLTSAG